MHPLSCRVLLTVPLFLTASALSAFGADPPAPVGSDWPSQLGPHGNYSSSETGLVDGFPPGGPVVLWRASTAPSYGPLSVAGGRVLAMSATRGVITKSTKDEAGMIFRQSWDYRGPIGITVYCLDAESGRELWKYTYEVVGRFPVSDWSANTADGPWGNYFGPKSAPTVDGDRVYTYDYEGTLNCLDLATGKALWSSSVREKNNGLPPRMGYAAPPLIAGPLVVVPLFADDAGCIAFDKLTGKYAWKGGRTGTVRESGPAVSSGNPDADVRIGKRWDGYSVPVLATLDGKLEIVSYTGGGVQAIDPANGRTLWELPIQHSTGEVVAQPMIDGNAVITASFYAHPCTNRINIESNRPALAWSSFDLKPRFANAVLYRGFVYASHGSHIGAEYRCLNAATGKPAWTTAFQSDPKGGKQMAQTLLADGKLILLTATGDLILAGARPEAYGELGRATLDLKPGTSQWWMPPALARGRLYARNTLGEIVCVDLRKNPPAAAQPRNPMPVFPPKAP